MAMRSRVDCLVMAFPVYEVVPWSGSHRRTLVDFCRSLTGATVLVQWDSGVLQKVEVYGFDGVIVC